MDHTLKQANWKLAKEIWDLVLAVLELIWLVAFMVVAVYAITHDHFYEGMILFAVLSVVRSVDNLASRKKQ